MYSPATLCFGYFAPASESGVASAGPPQAPKASLVGDPLQVPQVCVHCPREPAVGWVGIQDPNFGAQRLSVGLGPRADSDMTRG